MWRCFENARDYSFSFEASRKEVSVPNSSVAGVPPLEPNALTRRGLLQAAVVSIAPMVLTGRPRAQSARSADIGPYNPSVLLAGIRSRFVENGNALRMHVLE